MVENFLGGTAYVKAGNLQMKLEGGLKVNVGGVERTGRAGMDGVHGWTGKHTVPSIEIQASDDGSVSLDAIKGMANVTVTAELDNGKVYVLINAWQSGKIELDAAEAKFTVMFEGMFKQEMMG